MRHDHLTLDNGLEVVGEYRPEALSLAAGYFCRTGARDETAPESGVSHFLEHMMFKGTDELSYDDINKTFDRIGAQCNAFTSEENTVYYGQVLPEFQGDLVTLLSKMMRPALRVEDFTMEKNVILEEIAMYEDKPMWEAYTHCRKLHYGEHALGWPVLGTTQSITDLPRDTMADYFGRRYSPGNLTFAIAGLYDWEAAVARVTELTAGWQPFECVDRNTSDVPRTAGKQVMQKPRVQQCNAYFMTPGASAQDPARYIAAIAADVIGGGKSSRMFVALVEPGLAESAGVYHDEEDGTGCLAGALVCEPDRSRECVEIFEQVLADAVKDGLTADEVKRSQRRLATGLALSAEAPLKRLVSVGFDWVYRKEITPIEAVLADLEGVTVEDCNAWLTDGGLEPLTMVAVGPMAELS